MHRLPSNLKYLRKKFGISQEELADEFGIARSTLGDYERGRSEPSLETLIRFAVRFCVNIDQLITKRLEQNELEVAKTAELRVLAISVDSNNRSNIELVDTKAEAGYLDSYNDPEYIRELPKISFPKIPEGTYRGFEIRGDSMLPMESGSVVISSFVERIADVKDGKTYIIVSKDNGLVYKRVKQNKKDNKLILISDNEDYMPYEIGYDDISEIWQYYAHIGFSDAKASSQLIFDNRLSDIQKKVNELHHKMVGA